MNATTIEDSLAAALRERGGRVTPQRLAIAATLGDLDRHVTAENLYAEVSRRMRGVSLPTVYSTLDLLEELDLVRRVATVGGSVVYDPNVGTHHHLVCRACGAIVDVDARVDDAALLEAARAMGFAPELAQVAITGLCARCAAREASAG
ncbi:MAG: Fur family transcriptional regulator [Thermoleophilia bacterium]